MAGIPVLAASIGGLPEAVGEGGVLLDAEASVEVWSRTLSSLWDDEATYQRYVGLAERRSRRADLAPRTVGDRFESLLRDVVERAHSQVVE
jgi:glycosyltransferase involved in cell wall biosynthesis